MRIGFHLNILDEETGEWRDLDTIIDFEWLYGKLKPGRYQIVKTVMELMGFDKLRPKNIY